MKDNDPDPRHQAILQAAWTAFASYGYRKTSMDDIAQRAGMSRPALYLHYRNKQDIFRSLAQVYYDIASGAVEDALSGPDGVAEKLAAAFKAQAGELMEAMLTSPHGLELLDATHATAADIVQAGEQRLRGIYTAWLNRAEAAGQIELVGPADEMAGTITAALKGIKMSDIGFATYEARVQFLAAMVGSGLATDQ